MLGRDWSMLSFDSKTESSHIPCNLDRLLLYQTKSSLTYRSITERNSIEGIQIRLVTSRICQTHAVSASKLSGRHILLRETISPLT
jgi:hypothetical protein